jgi:hypothetical protein
MHLLRNQYSKTPTVHHWAIFPFAYLAGQIDSSE